MVRLGAEGAQVREAHVREARVPEATVEAGERETFELFLVVMGRMFQHITERAAEFDLSAPQAKALHYLAQTPTMGELAQILSCDASNVTGIVDRLEGRGLVERQVVPGDRRVKQLVLTEQGLSLWRALHVRVLADNPLLAGLSAKERTALHGLLSRVAMASG